MAVREASKLDFLLLAGGEELQKTVEMLPEQPTNYKSHMEKLEFTL